MKLQTTIEHQKPQFTIGYKDTLISIGSCFADNIGNYLQESLLNIAPNPFGVMYNPASVLKTLQNIRQNRECSEQQLQLNNGMYCSPEHHGVFSHPSKQQCIKNINSALAEAHKVWQKCSVLLLTFGTAWVYQDKQSGEIVANCHKLPADRFNRYMLSVDQIAEMWNKELQTIRTEKPDLKIIFTVSPIRHWKDGAHGNQLSKATLLLAIDKIKASNPNIEYFPAYEIVLDELRDYRFYAEDMLHPSSQTVQYIRETFCKLFMDEASLKTLRSVESYNQSVKHRPLHPDSDEWKKFTQRREENGKKLAIKLLHAGNYSCVIKSGDKLKLFTERGIKDLYRLYKQQPDTLKDAFIADKVVGKGAASLMILGGISEIYSDVISENAIKLLEKSNIIHTFAKQVPHIINRAGVDMCPVEKLCMNAETAQQALPLIEGFINKQQ